jgi:hypothetical protein
MPVWLVACGHVYTCICSHVHMLCSHVYTCVYIMCLYDVYVMYLYQMSIPSGHYSDAKVCSFLQCTVLEILLALELQFSPFVVPMYVNMYVCVCVCMCEYACVFRYAWMYAWM